MSQRISKRTDLLIKNGAIIPDPLSVFIDPAVKPEKIWPGTVIHPFCRVSGAKTSIGPGCVLGAETPLTIDNCQLGAGVKLAGGYCSGAVFMEGSSMGSCAHVRPGTILEECASAAHAVGLKQTVLFPYVILGSLINFCDCLMAGGTSRKNHSEVGSSYVHFNYTPHRDKATPSLIGDVPRGVFLDQPPVFLGGQGGLVGPARVAFGAIIPAGVVQRKDVMKAGLVDNPEQPGAYSALAIKVVGRDSLSRRSNRSDTAVRPYPAKATQFSPGAYRSIARIIRNNLAYIGNIHALAAWYRNVRALFMSGKKFQAACLAGTLEQIEAILRERIKRLEEIAEKMPESIALNTGAGNAALPYLRQQKDFAARWPEMKDELSKFSRLEGDAAKRDSFLAVITKEKNKSYLETIPALDDRVKANACAWLQSIVDRAAGIWESESMEEAKAQSGR
jgi:UDP-N-acetylglucosamine/UDP-N-acetylgalactosamine diphosphorylase